MLRLQGFFIFCDDEARLFHSLDSSNKMLQSSEWKGWVEMKKLSLKNVDGLTVREAFGDFKKHCEVKNLSPKTIRVYGWQYDSFERCLGDEAIPISDIGAKNVDAFILHLRSEKHNCNEITVNSYLRGVRAFLYYCMEMGYLESFKIRIPKATKKLKETYTDEELKALLKKPNLKQCDFTEYKIWVLSNYLLGTGNRIGTALELKIEDIDFNAGVIRLNHNKNRVAQIIPLSRALSKIIREYLRYRKGQSEDYVFCSSYGGKGDLRTYQDMISNYNRTRGVSKTSAHLYRHTFAKKWILNGGDIFRLQKILGHSDLSVVKEYVQMFGNDLCVDFDKYNPLDNTVKGMGDKIRV